MKEILTKEAVGHVLGHDLTQIIPGVYKGPRFKKGHVIKEEDIDVLLSMGKEHLYVLEMDETMLHENEAALILADLAKNEHMTLTEAHEGKIEVKAQCSGLLKVDEEKLYALNSFDQMMMATRRNNTIVSSQDTLCGTRIIPLVIEKEKMKQVQETIHGPILKLLPFQKKKVAIFATGNEVYSGKVKDAFTPVLKQKLSGYEVEIIHEEIMPDDPDRLTQGILSVVEKGADLVLCTGGMSVDPDDRTPLAIKNTKAEIISYGAPVLPGAMFLLAYHNDCTICGLPGCVMYAKKTIFDIVLPRIMANDPINREELAKLGHGGLCLQCDVCTYPKCTFGTGW